MNGWRRTGKGREEDKGNEPLYLSIDQGTTSTRALIFDEPPRVASAQQEFAQHYPADGWVEHDAEDIWRDTLATAKGALEKAGLGARTLRPSASPTSAKRWCCGTAPPAPAAPRDRVAGPAHRRSLRPLRDAGHEALVQERTGLLLDPIFRHETGVVAGHHPRRANVPKGRTGLRHDRHLPAVAPDRGREHKTDVTNASRTLLFDIAKQRWCPDLLALFRMPAAVCRRCATARMILA
jgi:glycerol kinase